MQTALIYFSGYKQVNREEQGNGYYDRRMQIKSPEKRAATFHMPQPL